ncbi:MAG: DUF3943 domain-containing protein [Spirochaetes bacterium]|nr:DUF3943 domain-containing protein [Spirochaetota bacterium]
MEKITKININDISINFPILKKLYESGFFSNDKYSINFPGSSNESESPDGIFLESEIRNYNNKDHVFFKLIPGTGNHNFMFTWNIPKKDAEDDLLNGSFNDILKLSIHAREKDINEIVFNNLASGDIQSAEPVYDDPENGEVTGYNIKIKSRPSQTHKFFRTLGELFIVNSFGVINYWINKDENMEDWEYKLTWEGVRRKITDGWSLDTNAFRTNTIYHIYAGNIYFQTGRSNEYGFLASCAWAFTGSLIWEYIGEFREQVSTNDMIFTTMGGALVGESLRQTSIFIEQNVDNKIIRYLFMTLIDPMRIINRTIDKCFYDDIDVNIIFVNPAISMIQQSDNQQYFTGLTVNW